MNRPLETITPNRQNVILKNCAHCGRTLAMAEQLAAMRAQRFCSHRCREAHQHTPAYLVAKFWSNVEKTPSCWLWTGCTDQHGYGEIANGFDSQSAHRVAYKLVNGYVPPLLRNDCGNRRCVRPDHWK